VRSADGTSFGTCARSARAATRRDTRPAQRLRASGLGADLPESGATNSCGSKLIARRPARPRLRPALAQTRARRACLRSLRLRHQAMRHSGARSRSITSCRSSRAGRTPWTTCARSASGATRGGTATALRSRNG
jgi:hypothetical protein